jgi:hypothetical protein
MDCRGIRDEVALCYTVDVSNFQRINESAAPDFDGAALFACYEAFKRSLFSISSSFGWITPEWPGGTVINWIVTFGG